jgi:murein L,D-transpeptidase YafK
MPTTPARHGNPVLPLAAAAALALALAFPAAAAPKHLAPVPAALQAAMQAADVAPNAPILVRAFKKEAEMEVWRQARNGRYVLVKTYPVCRWSGRLGPKGAKGDRQTPEGFYPVAPRQMNPNSAFHLSFDTGFPNAYDRSIGASGSALMVHGTCSSSGCYAMTDAGIEEIYALAREAFAGGQWAFQFQSFPFRLTAENIVRYRADPNVAFWAQLKEGFDRFEATKVEPTIGTSAKRYVYFPYGDRLVEAQALERINREAIRVAQLLSQGTQAATLSYDDGGMNPSFLALARAGATLGEVSRPEALAAAGVERAVPGTATRQAFRMPTLRMLPPPEAPPPAQIEPAMALADPASQTADGAPATPAAPAEPQAPAPVAVADASAATTVPPEPAPTAAPPAPPAAPPAPPRRF